MLSKNKLGFKMLGRVVDDPKRDTTKNGKDYVSLSLRVDSRPAPEGSKYKYEGEAVYVRCWGSRGESALHLQKGDRVEVWCYELERKTSSNGGVYFQTTAEALMFDAPVYMRMMQTYSNAAPMVETAAPAPLDRAPVPEADLTAQLDATDEDDLPF